MFDKLGLILSVAFILTITSGAFADSVHRGYVVAPAPDWTGFGYAYSPAYPYSGADAYAPYGQVGPYAGGDQGGDTSVLIQDRDFSAGNGNPYCGGRC